MNKNYKSSKQTKTILPFNLFATEANKYLSAHEQIMDRNMISRILLFCSSAFMLGAET